MSKEGIPNSIHSIEVTVIASWIPARYSVSLRLLKLHVCPSTL